MLYNQFIRTASFSAAANPMMALSSRRLSTSAGLMKLHFTHINPLRRQYFTKSSNPHAAWRLTESSRLEITRSPSLLSMLQKRTAYTSPRLSYWRQNNGQIVTWTTIALCGAVFGYQQWAQEQAKRHNNLKPIRFIAQNFVVNLSNLRGGRWWTLITCSFMHFTPIHLGFNAIALMSFGPMVVTCFGASGFVIGWLGSALSAASASLWWENHSRKSGKIVTGAVGASGSLFGFLTMIACFSPSQPVGFFLIPISFPMWSFVATTVGLSLTAIANSWLPGIGHAGHLGGITFGALYYALGLRRKRVPRF